VTSTVKRRLKQKDGPGPGSYHSEYSPIKSAKTFRFGSAAKKDNFRNRELEKVPGPGSCIADSSTLSKKAARIGLPVKEKFESKPGPGEYDSFDPSKSLSATKAVKMGTSQRRDIWEDQVKAAQTAPGAGAYLTETSTLSKKGAAIGLPRVEKLESRPGPGEYQPDAS
jgi:hypothetical protein